MTSEPNRSSPELIKTRTYNRADSVVFLKTKEEPFGKLSNMAGGFPLKVNNVEIRTAEALYQACRFPENKDLQQIIIDEPSPMAAKMKVKKHRHQTRKDWEQERVNIMRWCLQVKLALRWNAFSEILLKTEDKDIVEESRKDAFWGAKPYGHKLTGQNVLGKLLMELRESIKTQNNETLWVVEPLKIHDFKLLGEPIDKVVGKLDASSKSEPVDGKTPMPLFPDKES